MRPSAMDEDCEEDFPSLKSEARYRDFIRMKNLGSNVDLGYKSEDIEIGKEIGKMYAYRETLQSRIKESHQILDSADWNHLRQKQTLQGQLFQGKVDDSIHIERSSNSAKYSVFSQKAVRDISPPKNPNGKRQFKRL